MEIFRRQQAVNSNFSRLQTAKKSGLRFHEQHRYDRLTDNSWPLKKRKNNEKLQKYIF